MADKVSDKALLDATGKNWKEWFSILDKAGADDLDHKEIVKYLAQEHQVNPWWQQQITVTYERERGHREKHETKSGYEAGISKTISSPVADIFEYWDDAELRKNWLTDAVIDITSSTKNKVMRFRWTDGHSNIEVNFYPKGDKKTQLVVQHHKLSNAEEVTSMKNYWKEKLENLKVCLDQQKQAR